MSKAAREHCVMCDGETGRAGMDDDSLYCQGVGPFCQTCYDESVCGGRAALAAVPAEAIGALVERWQALARNADEGVKDAEPGGMTSFILSSAAGTFRDCAADLLKLLEAHNG